MMCSSSSSSFWRSNGWLHKTKSWFCVIELETKITFEVIDNKNLINAMNIKDKTNTTDITIIALYVASS